MADVTEVTRTKPPDPIVVRLDRLETGQAEIKADVAALDTKVAALDTKVSALDAKVAALDTKVAGLDAKVAGLDTKVAGLDTRIGDLDRHMHVLYENALERIAGISEHPLATKADIKMLVERIDNLAEQRIAPLETAIRTFSRVRRPKRG